MRALVYTAKNKVEMQTLDDPEPKTGEVVVRVREACVCGSDVLGFLGLSKKRVPPLVLGHEFAGEVEAVGSGVMDLAAGTRVAVMPLTSCGKCPACRRGKTNACGDRLLLGMNLPGGFAERVAVPRRGAVRMPEGMDFRAAAMAEPLATPANLFEQHLREPIETAAILGAGTQGLMSVQMAKVVGAKRIFAVDVHDARLETAKKLGATDPINAKSADPVKAILDATGGHGCDVVVDAVGTSATRQQGIKATARGGVFAMIGLHDPATEFDCLDIINRELEVHGVYAYTQATYEHALELIAGKKVDVTSWVRPFALEEGQSLFERLVSAPGDLVKASFRP